MIPKCLLAFLAGAVTEALCTWWVQSVASYRVLSASLLSMAWAAAMLTGLAEALAPEKIPGVYWVLWYIPAACWVVGYGVGTSVVVSLGKKRRKDPDPV